MKIKTNIFNVKEKKEERILIEEETLKNPILLFLKRHKNFLMLSIILFLVSVFLISIGVAFSLFGQSTDFDISYLNNSNEEVKANTNPDINDEDISEALLGEIGKNEGVVILVKTFMDSNNNVISYFSDKTSIIVKANGKMYRVSATEDGNYGINENGIIDKTAKQLLVKSTTTTLADGSVITNYSDGSAKIENKNITLFVRNSNKIKINNGTSFKNIIPSDVSMSTETIKKNNVILKKFTNNVNMIITANGKKYILTPNTEIKDEVNISYDMNNSFEVLNEKKLSDGNTLTYYENGSATIIDKNGNIIYVKKSGDIVIKDDEIYEIITNDFGYSKKDIDCGDGKKITYFDNGAAIIKNGDGTKQYIENSDDIIYDSNKNIISNPTKIEQISTKKTHDGYDVINFKNGKSEVIKKDGTSFIIDTNKLIFDTEGNITSKNNETKEKDKNKEEKKNKKEKTTEDENPLDGLFVSEAEYKFNHPQKYIQYTNFLVINNKNKKKRFSIVIEEISNYNKLHLKRLEPKYVKFQATIGNEYVSATKLDDNIWQDENNKVNYVIYEGNIAAKDTVEIAITLYVDYSELDNTKQDSTFVGTVKTYVIS